MNNLLRWLIGLLVLLAPLGAHALVEDFEPTAATYVIYTMALSGLLFLAVITIILQMWRWLQYAALALGLLLTRAAVSGALPYLLGGSEFVLWVVPYLVISSATCIGYLVAGNQLESPHPFARYRRACYVAAAVSIVGPLTSYFWLKVIPLNLMWLPQLVLFYSMYAVLILPPWTWQTDTLAQKIITRAFPLVTGIPFILLPFFEEQGYGLQGDTAQKIELVGIVVHFSYVWLLAIWLGVGGQRERMRLERVALEGAKNEAQLQLALRDAERDYQRARSAAALERKRLATVSHDLKQPLASLRLAVDRVADGSADSDPRALQRAVDYVEGLANSYGTNDRSDGAGLADDPETLDVRHGSAEAIPVAMLLESLNRMFDAQARECGVSLQILPSTESICVPPLDAMRVLSNVVANALQHADCKQVVIEINADATDVRITIRDDGKGMSPTELQAMRLSGGKGDNSEGDGLGITIVDDLCAAHDWALAVDSAPGAGTAITVLFPVAA